MRHNLTAVFNNRDDAQHVLDELLVSSYPHSLTTLVSPPEAGSAGPPPDAGLSGTVRQMLARLFASPHHEPERVDESAFLPGRHVITVTGVTDPDSAQAIGIIEHFSPVYVEDRHEQAEHNLVGAEPAVSTEPTLRLRRSGAHYPVGTAPGTLQVRFHDDSHLFGTQAAGDLCPRGPTYQEAMGSSASWDDQENYLMRV